jgi:AcrR family transcriptional regulator
VVDRPGTLLERRRDLLRRDIAAAAAALFADQGFSETTVEQIAERAGISVRTFYRYCQVKEDAVTAVLAEGSLSLAEAVAAQPPTGSLIEDVWTVFVENFERGEHADLQLRLARTVFTTPSLLERWVVACVSAQDALVPVLAERLGRRSTDLAVKTIAGALISALTAALQHSVLTGAPLGEAARTCLQIAQNGFSAINDPGAM